MKILITGCFGFIGYNFLNTLTKTHKNEFKIYGLDSLENIYSKTNFHEFSKSNIDFEFFKIDINNISETENYLKNLDAIVNFAAESHVDNSISNPEKFINSNVTGVAKLLKFSIKNNISKFYHVSTDEVYGSTVNNFFNENDVFNPSSPYSASKASAELIIDSFTKTYGYECLILRPANNYGIYQQPEKLIPYSISNLLSGKDIEIYGEGKNVRHWLHVDDTVSANLHLLENNYSNGIFNIGSGEYFDNLYVAKKILEALNLDLNRISHIKDRPGHDFRYAVNFNNLLNAGWSPQKKFDDEVTKITEWYKSNYEWWSKGIEEINKNRENRFNLTE